MAAKDTIEITRAEIEALARRAFESGYACGTEDDEDEEANYETRVEETWQSERHTLDIPG